MMAYRGFNPGQVPGFFRKAAELISAFDAALAAANKWIDGESIEVINIETVGMGETTPMQRSIRVWYRSRT